MTSKTETIVHSIRDLSHRASLTINEVEKNPLYPAQVNYTVWENTKSLKEKSGAFAVFGISTQEIKGKDPETIKKEIYRKILSQQKYLANSRGYHNDLSMAAEKNLRRLQQLNLETFSKRIAKGQNQSSALDNRIHQMVNDYSRQFDMQIKVPKKLQKPGTTIYQLVNGTPLITEEINNKQLGLNEKSSTKDIQKAVVNKLATQQKDLLKQYYSSNDPSADEIIEFATVNAHSLENEKIKLDAPSKDEIIQGLANSFAYQDKQGRWKIYQTNGAVKTNSMFERGFVLKNTDNLSKLPNDAPVFEKSSDADLNNLGQRDVYTKQDLLDMSKETLAFYPKFANDNANRIAFSKDLLDTAKRGGYMESAVDRLTENHLWQADMLHSKDQQDLAAKQSAEDFIKGINGSYAEKVNGKWQVHANDMALGQQEPGEVGYAAAEPLDKLPNDAPVYATSTNADYGEPLEPWTKQDFLDTAKEELEYSDRFAITKSNIKKLANLTLDMAIAYGNSSFEDGIVDDMQEYPEEYDQLTTKGKKNMEHSINQNSLAEQQKKVMANNPLPRVKDYSLKYIDLKQLKDNSEKESDYFIGKDELNDALKEGSRYGLLISSKNTMDEEANVVHPLVKKGLNYLGDLDKETLPKEIKNFTRDLTKEAPDKGEGYAIVCGAGDKQALKQATLKTKDLTQEQEMLQQQNRGLEL